MKIIQINVKDLRSFIKKFAEQGYVVEYGLHTILTDYSELASINIKKNNKRISIIIAHYISERYLSEQDALNIENYSIETTDFKHTESKWFIPVNPVIAIVLDNEVMNILTSYSDNYPINNGEELVNKYRAENPGYRNIPKLLFVRILEELRGED